MEAKAPLCTLAWSATQRKTIHGLSVLLHKDVVLTKIKYMQIYFRKLIEEFTCKMLIKYMTNKSI